MGTHWGEIPIGYQMVKMKASFSKNCNPSQKGAKHATQITIHTVEFFFIKQMAAIHLRVEEEPRVYCSLFWEPYKEGAIIYRGRNFTKGRIMSRRQ